MMILESIKVRLKDLKDNPWRNFKIDQIDENRIDMLVSSINEKGFWGGIVCRRNSKGEIEIAAGHTRVRAAIKAGYEYGHVSLGKFSDSDMIFVYGAENASQRDTESSILAQAGTVASALRFKVKEILRIENGKQMSGARAGHYALDGHVKSNDIILGQIQSIKGLGYEVVFDFLKEKIPGITEHSIKDQMVNFKASELYSEIVTSAIEEIKEENNKSLVALQEKAVEEIKTKKIVEERQKQVEEAKKKIDIANSTIENEKEKDSTFDYIGVAQYLSLMRHIHEFRRRVTDARVAPILPVNQQAPLAKQMTEFIKGMGQSVTEERIREYIDSKYNEAAWQQRKIQKEEDEKIKAKLSEKDKIINIQKEIYLGLDRAIDGIEKIIELTKNNQEYTISDQLKSSIRTWNKAMKKFNKLFPIEKEMDEPNDLTMIVDHYTIERESDV